MAIIEMPKDATGREIPLDTEVLYAWDGRIRKVIKWIFDPNKYVGWVVRVKTSKFEMNACPEFLYLTPPDTWEELEEDLGRGADALNYEACAYFGKSSCDCSLCIADKGGTCERVAMRDILTRIRKLRGED